MKLILTSDVAKLGKAGELVEVKDGFGRNYLIPQKLAILATKGSEKQVANITRARAIHDSKILANAKETKVQLDNLNNVILPVKITGKGKLFGSVSTTDVIDAIKTAGGPAIDSRKLVLSDQHIKKVGKYSVEVKLHPEVTARVAFTVKPEEGSKVR